MQRDAAALPCCELSVADKAGRGMREAIGGAGGAAAIPEVGARQTCDVHEENHCLHAHYSYSSGAWISHKHGFEYVKASYSTARALPVSRRVQAKRAAHRHRVPLSLSGRIGPSTHLSTTSHDGLYELHGTDLTSDAE